MKSDLKITKKTSFNVGSTSYSQYENTSDPSDGAINIAIFSKELIVAWSSTRYNSVVFRAEVPDPASYVNVRVCILPREDTAGEKHICCMAMTEYASNRFNQWNDGDRPLGFDVFFNKEYAIHELGLDENNLKAQMSLLENGKIVNDCAVYIDVVKNADFVRDVFFSTDSFDAIKKINIAAIASRLIVRILGAMTVDGALPQPNKDLLKIRLAKNFIEENISKIINVDDISRQIGVSQSKLMKTFRNIENKTIGDYIIERKMYSAAILISKKICSISEVAYKVGYDHPSNFSTAFKKYHGVTPREFQNMRRNAWTEV